MNTYANVVRLYCYGDVCAPCLFDVVRGARTLTINRKFTCGGQNGTWQDVPFKEVETRPAEIPPETDNYKISKYALGKDYHFVIKEKKRGSYGKKEKVLLRKYSLSIKPDKE